MDTNLDFDINTWTPNFADPEIIFLAGTRGMLCAKFPIGISSYSIDVNNKKRIETKLTPCLSG